MPFSLDPQPGENEIECARCGALIYDQLSRCPECGVNLYEPEEEYDDELSGLGQGFSVGFGQKVKDFFRRLFGKPFSAEEVFGASLDQAFYYHELLQKIGGDHSVVERLIEYEKTLYPNGTRILWLKNAIQRWDKDNRISSKTD